MASLSDRGLAVMVPDFQHCLSLLHFKLLKNVLSSVIDKCVFLILTLTLLLLYTLLDITTIIKCVSKCLLLLVCSSPVSSQEAQAGGTDFVIEYDHGQDPT